MTKLSTVKNPHQDWEQIFLELDRLVLEGKHQEVQKILADLNVKKIPREWAARFGEQAFKVHAHLHGLKALHRFVHPENTFNQPASNKEKLIYASALYSLGSIRESIAMIEEIDVHLEPESLFYRALAGFYEWDYESSIPYLEKFVSTAGLTPARRILGKINLAAALVSTGQYKYAGELLENIKTEAIANNFNSFVAYCLEIQAQAEIFQRRFDRAQELLLHAKTLIEAQGGVYLVLVEKWLAICECLSSNASAGLERLDHIRERAAQASLWDTVRECDLFEAIAKKDGALVRKVIMGSPSEHYRARARSLFGEDIRLIGQFDYDLTAGAGEPTKTFDPYSEKLFKKPQLLKLFDALTQDFYKPSTLGVIFQRVFSEEIFNPFSSPPRVLVLMKRLDKWFAENELPLRIEFKKSEFRLKSLSAIRIKIRRGKALSVEVGKLSEIKTIFSSKTFTTNQVANALMLSKFSVQEILNKALESGQIAKRGTGRGTSYQFVNSKKGKIAG